MINKKQYSKIIEKYDSLITGINDLTADSPPSILFYFLANTMSYLLSNNPDISTSSNGIYWRRAISPFIRKVGKNFLTNPQIIENRNYLRDPSASVIEPDKEIVLPNSPVIWIANHGFKDDTLASILAIKRHAYILFGSLPQFYNTFDGITAWLIGVVMTNRKIAESKKSSIDKSIKVLNLGSDLLIFPEGVWNKSPNRLLIDFWPGVYRIACETGAKVVPITHYIKDPNNKTDNNPIHTVIDDPIQIDNMQEKEALDYLRNNIATWKWLMMEIYGKSTRNELLCGESTSAKAWERHLLDRVATASRYDKEIELCADYRPKNVVSPEDVWKTISEIKNPTKANILDKLYANIIISEYKTNDYQRRF